MTLDIYTDFWSTNPDMICNLLSACCSDFRVFYRFKILDTFILGGLFSIFWNEVIIFKTGSPGWPPILYIAKAGLEPLVFLPPPSETWDFRHVPPKPWLFFFFSFMSFTLWQTEPHCFAKAGLELMTPLPQSPEWHPIVCRSWCQSLTWEHSVLSCKCRFELSERSGSPGKPLSTSFCFPVRWKEPGELLCVKGCVSASGVNIRFFRLLGGLGLGYSYRPTWHYSWLRSANSPPSLPCWSPPLWDPETPLHM